MDLSNEARANKKLYLIGGVMGIGKTATCRILNKKLPNSVFLDGDWCWYSDPLIATTETKKIVIDNITHALNNFINCSAYDNIIFCWILNKQGAIDAIKTRLNLENCQLCPISLVCSPEALKQRIAKDIKIGKRDADALARSLALLPEYDELDTIKIDTSNLDINNVVDAISRY